NTRANAPIEDVLALAAALDVAPIHLIVPVNDEATISVASKLADVPARIAREWVGGRAPLRHTLGIALTPAAVATLLAEQPEEWIRRAARAMGLTDDQQEDTIWSLRQGKPAWSAGRPTVTRQQLGERREQLQRELDAIDEDIRKEDDDG